MYACIWMLIDFQWQPSRMIVLNSAHWERNRRVYFLIRTLKYTRHTRNLQRKQSASCKLEQSGGCALSAICTVSVALSHARPALGKLKERHWRVNSLAAMARRRALCWYRHSQKTFLSKTT